MNSLMGKFKEIHPQVSILKIIVEHMEKIRYLYKSDAYAYEKECRFVLLESDIKLDDICFECQGENDSPVRIRHYYEHKDLEIRKILTSGSEIVIGPCVPHRHDVKYCIEALLHRAGLNDSTAVKLSEIEYRKP